jgi:hypothetical protein
MGSMTIGAKYKTTIKDPGTPGILRMVRATLPFSLTPCGSLSLHLPPDECARSANKLRAAQPAPLLRVRVFGRRFLGRAAN